MHDSVYGCYKISRALGWPVLFALAMMLSAFNADSATPVATRASRGPAIDGEHFTVRQVIDRQQGGIVASIFIAPEKWRDRSEVMWNYANVSFPVRSTFSLENPGNDEAMYGFPAAAFFSLRPATGFSRPGQNYLGLIYASPQAPLQILLAFVQSTRDGMEKFQVVGGKTLPGLRAALNLPKSANEQGVGIKVNYDLNGKPIEEEFYAVYYALDIPYDGPQGRTYQTNWGLTAIHSFRAQRGTLDKRRPVFAAIAKSFRPNPAWQQRLAAVNAYLTAQFNRQLQAGYDQIAAAGALSRQISANNDAMLASIDHQLRSSRTTSSVASERSANDKFSDSMRGVETLDDPYYGSSQHSYNDSYHWTDGYGSYRNSNDPSYNPNHGESGDWQQMTPTR